MTNTEELTGFLSRLRTDWPESVNATREELIAAHAALPKEMQDAGHWSGLPVKGGFIVRRVK